MELLERYPLREFDPIFEALQVAVATWNEARFRELLAEGASPEWAMDVVVIGAREVRGAFMRILLDRGIDVKVRYSYRRSTLLAVAAELGDEELMERLIALGADPAEIDEDAPAALDRALARGRFRAARLLAALIGDGRTERALAEKSLLSAVVEGRPDELDPIFDAAPELLDDDGRMACAWADAANGIVFDGRDRGDDLRIRLLQRLEARLEERRGITVAELPLARAAVVGGLRSALRAGHADLFAHVLSQCGRQLLPDELDELLVAAVAGQSLALAGELVDHVLADEALDQGLAAVIGYFDLQELLEEDFGIPSRPEREALPMAKLLLEAGASPDTMLHDVISLLMCAAARHHVALVRLLLQHGADPNLEDLHGRSALGYARRSTDDLDAQRDTVRLLLEHGAREAAWMPAPRE